MAGHHIHNYGMVSVNRDICTGPVSVCVIGLFALKDDIETTSPVGQSSICNDHGTCLFQTWKRRNCTHYSFVDGGKAKAIHCFRCFLIVLVGATS